jgi:hypothetical protein
MYMMRKLCMVFIAVLPLSIFAETPPSVSAIDSIPSHKSHQDSATPADPSGKQDHSVAVPEPGTLLILGSSLAAALALKRKKAD